MPYIFPRRRLKDGDILDPVDLNDDVIPVVEVYAGGLNEHSFVAGGAHGLSTLIDGSIATNAYYSFYEESRVINPHFGSAAPFGMADRTDILSTDKIPNDAGWYALPLNDAGDTEVVVNKGNSVLLVETTVQYGISDEKFRRSNYTAAGVLVPLTGRYLQGKGQGARVQFALRLDGAVVPWTITGHADTYHTSPRGEKPAVAYKISSADELLANAPGPRVSRDSDLGMLGPSYFALRISALLSLTAGRHQIELVARRLPLVSQTNTFSSNDTVQVYTRRMFVMATPQVPRSASAVATLDAAPFDSESLLSQARLDGSISVARNSLNAVEEGALARGALRGVALPPAYLAAAMGAVATPTSTSFQSVFPGWNNLTNFDPGGVGTGWYPMATPAVVVPTLAGAGQTAKILVLANVHVEKIDRYPNAGVEEDIIGMLGISMTINAGAKTMLQESLVWFNSTQNGGGKTYPTNLGGGIGDVYTRDNLDIALMAVVDISATATYTFEVHGCLVPTVLQSAASNVTGLFPSMHVMVTKNQNISAIVLRN